MDRMNQAGWASGFRIPTHERPCENPGNTTHGSGWMVQAQPTKRAARHFVFYISLPSRRERREENRESRAVPCVGWP